MKGCNVCTAKCRDIGGKGVFVRLVDEGLQCVHCQVL